MKVFLLLGRGRRLLSWHRRGHGHGVAGWRLWNDSDGRGVVVTAAAAAAVVVVAPGLHLLFQGVVARRRRPGTTARVVAAKGKLVSDCPSFFCCCHCT